PGPLPPSGPAPAAVAPVVAPAAAVAPPLGQGVLAQPKQGMELLLQKYADHSAAAGGDGAKSADAAVPKGGYMLAAPEQRVLRPRDTLTKPSRYAMVEDG